MVYLHGYKGDMPMWFCFNDGFVSVVEDTGGDLMIRARRMEELKNIVGDNHQIYITKNSDYRFRCFMSRTEWEEIVVNRIENINYSNFKDSVKDEDLHDMYADMWVNHYYHQVNKYGHPKWEYSNKREKAK